MSGAHGQEIVLVAAIGPGGVIGARGALPWHLPEDLAHFKALTMGHPMIMGRRTFEAIGRALPGRRSIVLTRDPAWRADGAQTAADLPAALAAAGPGTVMIIGGGQVYADTIDIADRLEITVVDREVEGDTFFPPLDTRVWEEQARIAASGCSFVTYSRRTASGSGPSEPTVRPALPDDLPALGAVQAAVWRDAFAGIVSDEVLEAFVGAAFAQGWRPALEAPLPRRAVLLACAGERVVGLAAFGPTTDPDGDEQTAELHVLGVLPEARRAGHGSRLVNAVVGHARREGYTWLQAWVPLPAESARGLLTAAGMGPDRARRRRVVDPDGRTVTEVRLGAGLDAPG